MSRLPEAVQQGVAADDRSSSLVHLKDARLEDGTHVSRRLAISCALSEF
jgi:hypothetical protein